MVNKRRRYWMAWLAGTGVTLILLALALLPPFVDEELRYLVMQAFAPLCHQMPERSPHLYGVVLAVCDRCLGVYVGLPAAGLLFLAVSFLAEERLDGLIYRYAGPVLALALIPMGLDWLGPVVGWWPNTPWTRLATGLLFGLPAGYLFVRGVVRGLAPGAVRRTAERESVEA